MPLPLPTLDRRTFAELVAEGRSLIPRLATRWTDHNVHDSGIMLLELFAWLVEMDVYRLDRLSVQAQRAFLRMLGIELRPPQVAETVVVFSTTTAAEVQLPAGSQVTETACFQTAHDLNVSPARLTGVCSGKDKPESNFTAANAPGGKQVTGTAVFQTAHDLNVSPARLTGVFTGKDKPESNFTGANAPGSERYLPFGAKPQSGNSIFLGFDRPLSAVPVEISLFVWTGSAGDRQTRADLITDWDAATAELGENCVPHWSLHYSAHTVWEYRATGSVWKPLTLVIDETRAFTLSGPVRFTVPQDHEPDSGDFWIRCRLVRGEFECPPQVDAIALNAVLARHETSVAEQPIGISTGRAGQFFDLQSKPVIAGSTTLRVMLGCDCDEPWSETLLWDLAGPHDRLYLLAPERGEIVFGTGRTGRVPPAGAKILCSHRVGGGPEGNVPAGSLKVAPKPELAVLQPFKASGGAPAETLADAQGRGLAALKRTYRAVTLTDFEVLALETPGVPIARARALAEHHPALPCFRAPGCVTIVVIPNCPDPRPEPGPDLLLAVKRHLERRRTLATELHIIGPAYTPVTVHARLQAADVKATRARALHALSEFFHPLRGGPDRNGWPVGRDVYRSEVLALLAGLPGVDFVDRFGLETEGDVAPRCGNVPVCAGRLVASGEHQLELVKGRSR